MSKARRKQTNARLDERHWTIILEDLQNQFRVFGEGQVTLIQKVDRLEQRMDSLEYRVSNLESHVSSLAHHVSILQNDVSLLQRDVSILQHDVKDLHTKFDRSFTTLSDHETRITTLEKITPT